MGVHVWGGAYVIGLAFLIAAPLLSVSRWSASLTYGVLWGAALLAFGGHYWRLARSSVAGELTLSEAETISRVANNIHG